jgi:hypothetical protein
VNKKSAIISLKHGSMEAGKHGSGEAGKHGSGEAWNLGTMELWNFGTLKLLYPEPGYVCVQKYPVRKDSS